MSQPDVRIQLQGLPQMFFGTFLIAHVHFGIGEVSESLRMLRLLR